MQRPFRLRRKEDFDRLRKTGRAWRHPFLILSVAPNCLAHNRYGFVTSKRLGKAVTRTRLRRVLREIVRREHPSLIPGYDMVFIARDPMVGQPYHTIYQAVVDGLDRFGLRQPPLKERQP